MNHLFITVALLFSTMSFLSFAAFAQMDYYPSNQNFLMAMTLDDSWGVRSQQGQKRSHKDLSIRLKEKVAQIMEDQGFAGFRNQYETLLADEEDGFGVVLVEVPEMSDIEQTIDEMWSYEDVLWAYPNFIYFGDYRESLSQDPYLEYQKHLPQIFAPNAWKVGRGEADIVVAVTDNGFDLHHEDMQGTYYRNPHEIPDNGRDDDGNGYIDDVYGWNFNAHNNDIFPSPGRGEGHGTHIAGIIAADTFNEVGVAGVAPNVQVMPLKWTGENPWTSAIIFETYAYAAKQGARIISTSYNVDFHVDDPTYIQALHFANDKGILVFNSAGNSGTFNPPRSGLDQILLVGSVKAGEIGVGETDRRSHFSNYGDGIDISAPGEFILSTHPGDRYTEERGTSQAAPIAAAVAALIWSHDPTLTASQVAHKLLTTCDPLHETNPEDYFYMGAGRPNAYAALEDSVRPLRMEVGELGHGMEVEGRDLRELTVKFYGVAQKFNRPFSLISAGEDGVLDTHDDREVALSYTEHVLYGTNYKKIRFPLPLRGQYRFTIWADAVADPFGQALDGDGDGIPGGDYVLDFSAF
ncbi:MAG: S8 family serine peptidase [Bacteriovoracales bacterium]|nr:S8 family serine peptidase [Bacteriovoracales bacterium]